MGSRKDSQKYNSAKEAEAKAKSRALTLALRESSARGVQPKHIITVTQVTSPRTGSGISGTNGKNVAKIYRPMLGGGGIMGTPENK